MKSPTIQEWNKFKQELKDNINKTLETNNEHKEVLKTMLNMLENIKVRENK